jgi:hypothetical protein
LPPGRALAPAVVSLLIGTCASIPASALQPLVTDDTETQGTGGNQLEVAFDHDRLRIPGERSTERAWTLVYTRGLTDMLDGFVELTHVRIRSNVPGADASGRSNPVLGFKWRLWESEAQGLSIGLKPEVRFGVSTASERRGLGAGRAGYAATLIVTKATQFGAVHANLAAAREDYSLAENRAGNRRMLYRLSVAPVVDLTPTWKIALDAGVLTNPDRAEGSRMGFVELGAIWAPREDLEIALGFIRQVADGEPSSRTLTAGITWRF